MKPTTFDARLSRIACGKNPATSADAEESRMTENRIMPTRPMWASPSPWRRRLAIMTPAKMSDMIAIPAETHVT